MSTLEPGRPVHLHHRRFRLRQVDADQRHALPPPPGTSTARRRTGTAPRGRPRPVRQGDHVDQAPIGRTPRSNPATYTGLLTPIRDLFAGAGSAGARLRAGRFSFNVKGGALRSLPGRRHDQGRDALPAGHLRPRDVCHGKRYNRETLEIQYKGRNIHDMLGMTVEQAREFFACRAGGGAKAADAGRRRA